MKGANYRMTEGIKSKDRVQKHGEVFTPDKIVNDMLDLIDNELKGCETWEYLDKTYLEPACGTGNFLIRILDRKLARMQTLPREQWTLGLLHCLASIYAVDIQQDNVNESKERLVQLIKTGTSETLGLDGFDTQPFHFEKMELSEELENAVRGILEFNILEGNTLSGKKVKACEDTEDPLMIMEYIWKGETVAIKPLEFDSLKSGDSTPATPSDSEFIHYTAIKNPKAMTDEEKWLEEQNEEDIDMPI